MFSLLKKFTDAFKPAVREEHNDIVYFGGFEENAQGENELLFALFVPTKSGLVYLPYGSYDDFVITQLRSMEIGEGFLITQEESVGGVGGNVLEVTRIMPPMIIRIEGKPTNFPDAPLYSVLSL